MAQSANFINKNEFNKIRIKELLDWFEDPLYKDEFEKLLSVCMTDIDKELLRLSGAC